MAKTVAAADFASHSIAIVEEVAETQEEVVITRDGKPLAKVIPTWTGQILTLEELRASARIVGDIEEPLGDWDMMK